MKPEASATRAANYTILDTDMGIRQDVTVDGVVLTLPAAAPGKVVRVRNAGAAITGGPVGANKGNKNLGFTVRPAGSDTMTGFGFTPAAAKGAVNVKANAYVGDSIELVGGTGTWYLGRVTQSVAGAWAREA